MGLVARRGRPPAGRRTLSAPLRAGRPTTTVRTTGKRTSSVLPKVGRQPLLPATVVARGKLRPLWTLSDQLPDPPPPTLPSLHSTPSLPPQDQARSTLPSPAWILWDPPPATTFRPS